MEITKMISELQVQSNKIRSLEKTLLDIDVIRGANTNDDASDIVSMQTVN